MATNIEVPRMASTAATTELPLAPYVYSPLRNREIRLLYLEPADDIETPVCGKLVVQGIGAQPYNTLSYAWGPTYSDGSHLAATISIADNSLQVTENLLQALKRLRKVLYEPPKNHRFGMYDDEHAVIPIWMDAICINMSDLTERMHQVALMADIYKTEERSLIWLGEVSSRVDDAGSELQIISHLTRDIVCQDSSLSKAASRIL